MDESEFIRDYAAREPTYDERPFTREGQKMRKPMEGRRHAARQHGQDNNVEACESGMEQSPRIGDRIADKSAPPDDSKVHDWIGREAFAHWARLRSWIDESYPGVFEPDWLHGGKNRGWSLRYTRTKAFCSLVPAYRLFSVLVVLGGAEREKFEERRSSWSPQLVKLYDETPTFHDGKWMTVAISSADHRREVTRLLSMKRPPLSRH